MPTDDVLPTGSPPRLVVGVAACCRAAEAIERLLAVSPNYSGMAFLILQSGDPCLPRLRPEQLGRLTTMDVVDGTDATPLRRDTVYLLRPGMGVEARHGLFVLSERLEDDPSRVGPDRLFETLAAQVGPRAVGIVLCGSGTAGSQGVPALRSAGGLTIAQECAACEIDEMPRAAIDTGAVDLVLVIEKIPQVLEHFAGVAEVTELLAEQKRLEAALRQSEERHRLAAQVAKVGTFDWRVPTDEHIWTPEQEALYGLPPGGFGRTYEDWIRWIHPDDVASAKAALREALETGSFKAQWRAVWPDGSIRWLEARGWVEKDSGGTPLRMIGVNLDITDRKQAEDALRQADELRRLSLESAQMGSWSLDLASGNFIWDERSQELSGLARAVVPLEAALARIHPDDRQLVEDMLAEAARSDSDRVYDIEFRAVPPDEPTRWVRGVGRVHYESTKRGGRRPVRFIGVLMDVTEQKSTEQALREASRRKDEYLAMLSHELRNPLAAIRTAGELIKLSSDPASTVGRASAVLERQSGHMAKLLDGLLDVSRITRGKLRTERRDIDLIALLRDVLSDHEASAKRKRIDLRAEFEPESLPIHADPARLTQVFANLVGNAIKYTDSGGVVTVQARTMDERAEVIVRDTGIGFEPESADRLFDAFQQGPQDISRSSGGLGLGLALARGLIELHGGTIAGRSEGVGQGAEFVVQLPLSPTKPIAAGSISPIDRQGLHVLVIEDNEDSAEMLRTLLELAGHDVEVATRGQQGVDLAKGHHPDVVLCDIGLPNGMTGFDVAQQLRGDPSTRDVPLVALTGYGRPDDKARSAQAGFDAHLVKPIDTQTLEQVLARLAS